MINLGKNSFGPLLATGLMAAAAGTSSASLVNNEIPGLPSSTKVSADDVNVPVTVCDNLRRELRTQIIMTGENTAPAENFDFLRKWHFKNAVMAVIEVSPTVCGRFEALQREQRALNAQRHFELDDEVQRNLSGRWRALASYVEQHISITCSLDVSGPSEPTPQYVPQKRQQRKPKAKTAAP